MKSPLITATILVSLFQNYSFCQEEKTEKKIKIEDVQVQGLFCIQKNNIGSILDFQTLSSNSTLSEIPDSFQPSQYRSYNGGMMYSINVGIQLKNKNKSPLKGVPLLRLGVSSYTNSHLTSNYYKSESGRYDTLVSTQTGEMTFVDTTNIRGISMDYYTQQIKINAAFYYRTNTEKRLSMYYGLGIAPGISIHSNTYISKSYQVYESTSNEEHGVTYYPYGNGGNVGFSQETYKNKNSFCFSAFVPVGIDFRLAKNKSFFKHVRLHYEVRTAFNYSLIPNLRAFTNFNFQHGLGIRYTFL